MTQITPFDYGGQSVRVVEIDGEPWFVLADLVKVLGFARSASAVSDRLEDEVRRTYPIADSLGRTQNATVVSEAGMYEVVIRSDKPEAIAFRRWITTEVLPAIRKTGSYGTPRELTPDEIVHQALQITSQRVEELTAEVKVLAPKAAAFDHWLSSNVAYAVGDVAKALNAAGADTGQNRLFGFMEQHGWIYRRGGHWHAMQSQSSIGRIRTQLGTQLNTRTGETFQTVTVRIYPKGAIALAKLYGVDGGVVADSLDGEVAA